MVTSQPGAMLGVTVLVFATWQTLVYMSPNCYTTGQSSQIEMDENGLSKKKKMDENEEQPGQTEFSTNQKPYFVIRPLALGHESRYRLSPIHHRFAKVIHIV